MNACSHVILCTVSNLYAIISYAIVAGLQASSFMMFPDMNTACRAAGVLRTETAVDAVEVFDRAALRECEADEGLTKLVVDIKGADPGAAALLIECRGEDAETLQVCFSKP